MIKMILILSVFCLSVTADEPGELFEEAEQLARRNQKTEAMAKVTQAIAAVERAVEAGEEISWQGRNGLRFAARLAREDFLDYEMSLSFCDKLEKLADSDYWQVPAQLERALTFRAMGDFSKAQKLYDTISLADARQRANGILPEAEMVYFDMRDCVKGREMIEQALLNDQINGRERVNVLRRCAEQAMARGDRETALSWYGLLAKMPFAKPIDRDRFLSRVLFEMGKVEESRGRNDLAKEYYRKSVDLKDGEMRYRARARDALENIEYFE